MKILKFKNKQKFKYNKKILIKDLILFLNIKSEVEFVKYSLLLLIIVYFIKSIYLLFLSYYQNNFISKLIPIRVNTIKVDTLKQKLYDIKPLEEVQKNYEELIAQILWGIVFIIFLFLATLIIGVTSTGNPYI